MTQHTQPLQHTPKNATNVECQQNDHSIASITAKPSPISQSLKDITDSNVLIADAKESNNKCEMQDQQSMLHTAVNVHVVEKVNQDFLPLTTLTAMEGKIEMQVEEDCTIIVGSLKTISLKMASDSFATIVIVDEGNSENAPTKINARLIAASPRLLEALEKIATGDFEGESSGEDLQRIMDYADTAIALAKGTP